MEILKFGTSIAPCNKLITMHYILIFRKQNKIFVGKCIMMKKKKKPNMLVLIMCYCKSLCCNGRYFLIHLEFSEGPIFGVHILHTELVYANLLLPRMVGGNIFFETLIWKSMEIPVCCPWKKWKAHVVII